MIKQERLFKEFEKLVSFDAESYEERSIADYLKRKLASLGISVYEDTAGRQLGGGSKSAGNLYAYLDGKGSLKTKSPILFSAHMDTVKPGKGKSCIRHENGRITSDGTTVLGADDAAGLAEILEMLTILQENDLPHPPLEIILPVAEEPYARGSQFLEYDRIKSREAYVLDMSGPVGRAANAAPTILSLSIEIRGKAAHAGFNPEDGIHAIAAAAKALSKIKNGRTKKGTTINIGTIQGGTGQNIVPEFCIITGEIRGLDHNDSIEQANLIRDIFKSEVSKACATVNINVEEMIHAYRTGHDQPVVTRFQSACQKLGLPGNLEDTFGGSDQNQFSKHGIDGIVLANAMNLVHSTQEYTCLNDMVKVVELILKIIELA